MESELKEMKHSVEKLKGNLKQAKQRENKLLEAQMKQTVPDKFECKMKVVLFFF